MILGIKMNQEQIKKMVGEYAIKYVLDDMIVGVGTGSTVKYFIAKLADIKHRIQGVVSSSLQSTRLLKEHKISVFDLNAVGTLDLYIDGADEVNHNLQMIKGGGAALTHEKIIAACSKKFVCIVDQSKYIMKLGMVSSLPVEVIPIARSYVAREIVKLGGMPNWRENIITDNGNWILDIYNLDISLPIELEQKINNITGVVSNGLFAKRGADELVIGKTDVTLDTIYAKGLMHE
jgi:ribose 5-phosphate isomerase A